MNKKQYSAVIDIGSNASVLAIANIRDGKATLVERIKQIFPLGIDTYKYGSISQRNIELLLEILTDFKRKLKEYPAMPVDIVSTSAVNEAANKILVKERVREVFGQDMEVLTGPEEAALLQLGLRVQFPEFEQLKEEGLLVLDLGYGSIQLTQYHRGKLVFTQNILLGSLRVNSILAELEQHSANYRELMTEYISGDLAYFKSFQPKRTVCRHLVMTGFGLDYWRTVLDLPMKGTVKFQKRDFIPLQEKLSADGIKALHDTVIPSEDLAHMLPMAIVMRGVLDFLDVDEAYLSSVNLDDGVVIRRAIEDGLIVPSFDPADHTIQCARQMAKRFRTDKRHVEHVERLSLSVFDQMAEVHRLGKRERLILQVGAILHNVGKYVTMHNDSSLNYHMIHSADLIGLSPEDLEMVALLGRYHNNNWDDSVVLERLSESEKLILFKLSAILEIANAMDAGHQQKIRRVDLKISRSKVRFRIRTSKDHALESWAFNRHTRTFEEVFGRKPILIDDL